MLYLLICYNQYYKNVKKFPRFSSQTDPIYLENIVKKAVGLQKHLKANKGDNRNVRSLELIEAKVHRLSVYYKRIGRIPQNWKYKSVVAQLE